MAWPALLSVAAVPPGCGWESRLTAEARVWSAQPLPRVPTFKNHSFFITCQSPRSAQHKTGKPQRSMLRELRAGIPALGSRFPHTIKKHFVLNKTRQSIYIPQLGRAWLILAARGGGRAGTSATLLISQTHNAFCCCCSLPFPSSWGIPLSRQLCGRWLLHGDAGVTGAGGHSGQELGCV